MYSVNGPLMPTYTYMYVYSIPYTPYLYTHIFTQQTDRGIRI